MKWLKNKIYLSAIIGTLLSIISLLTLIFIENKTYFTVIFASNIIVNFVVTGIILVANDKLDNVSKFKIISTYLMVTLFVLLMDVLLVSNTWDTSSYSTLMYLTNVKLYLSIYACFVLVIVLMSLYSVIKILNSKENTDSTKDDKTKELISK